MTADEVINIIFETVEEMRPFFVPNPETRGKTSTGNMAFKALQVRVRTYQRNPPLKYLWTKTLRLMSFIQTNRGFLRNGAARKTRMRVGGINFWKNC